MRDRLSPWVGGLLLGAVLFFPQPSAAQGAYTGAALMGDFIRLDRYDAGGSGSPAGGEALGFALRLGTPLGRNWGVELELARPALIESDETPDFIPLAASSVTGLLPPGVALPPGLDAGTVTRFTSFPAFAYRIHTARRNTTLGTTVWAAQEVSRRVSLVYLGGVGFHRATSITEWSFERYAALPFAILPSPSRQEVLLHSVQPLVGFEARIGLTDHVQLVPGIRMHGVSGGWLIRPAAGLAWQF